MGKSQPKPLNELQIAQMTAKSARQLREEGQGVAAVQRLAEAFPSIDDVEGVEPWEFARFQSWGDRHVGRAHHAARFVLSVYEPESVSFDVHAALAEWTEVERAAFCVWANKPWWPE